MCSSGSLQTSLWRGCPIRSLRDHRLDAAPPERFVGLHVLHRPHAPRHPPRTLCSLFSMYVLLVLRHVGVSFDDVHCVAFFLRVKDQRNAVFFAILCFNSCRSSNLTVL